MTASVRRAEPTDVSTMRRIGSAAGARFAAVDDPRIAACADDDPFDADDLLAWIDAERAWVAMKDGSVVGFALVDLVDGNAHVEEVSVLPTHEGRGHGSALLEAVATWARDHAIRTMTLTTFSDVPWNRPYYERRGFDVLPVDALGPELARRVRDEEAHGLPSDLRVAMRRTI